MRICACCGTKLHSGMTTGESGLYNPNGSIELCEPCFFLEDDLIEEVGGNNIPNALEAYRVMLGESTMLLGEAKVAAAAVRRGEFPNVHAALRATGQLLLSIP